MRTFAPTSRPAWWDGGQPAEALGPWSEERRRELADQLDCVVVRADPGRERPDGDDSGYGPGDRGERYLVEGLGSQNAERCPTVWLTHDQESANLLKASNGVAAVEVVPELAILASRLFSKRLLRKRLQYQRLMGWYPPGHRVLVVQGDEDLAKDAPIAAEILGQAVEAEPDLALVVIEADGWRNDAAFATVLEEALPVRPYRLPPTASLEDIVSVIWASTVFIGSSLAAHAVALAFERPAIGLDLAGSARVDGMLELGADSVRVVRDAAELNDAVDGALAGFVPSPREAASAIRRLDSSLDGIAKLADESANARARAETGDDRDRLRRRLSELEARLAVVEAAYEVRGQRLVAERFADADVIWELRQKKGEVEARLVDVEARLVDVEARLVKVRASWKESVTRLEATRAEDEARRATLERALDDEQMAHAEVQAELARTRATRTFRYSAGARRLYGVLRRNLR